MYVLMKKICAYRVRWTTRVYCIQYGFQLYHWGELQRHRELQRHWGERQHQGEIQCHWGEYKHWELQCHWREWEDNATEEENTDMENYNTTEWDSSNIEEPNTKESKSKENIHIECENYLRNRGHHAGASKLEKVVIRKRRKNFQIMDAILHYRGKDGLQQVVTDAKTKEKIS